MDNLAIEIAQILDDYHSYVEGFKFTPEHVLKWIEQFEEDEREFILTEFLHLLKQGIYISEKRGRELLIEGIEQMASKSKSVPEFLSNVEFLHLQAEEKSQSVLLKCLDEELNKKYGMGLKQCGTKSKKIAIYIDDIIASGNTVYTDLKKWLAIVNQDGETNYTKIIGKTKYVAVFAYCIHNWQKIEQRLIFDFDSKIVGKIFFKAYHTIENHRFNYNQRLNFAFPINTNNPLALKYVESLKNAERHPTVAFRKNNQPKNESFFSTADNRIRFENVLLQEGIKLLNKRLNVKMWDSHRPMGETNPSFKILGTGTLFFTWRNISNTCPIVFWWKYGGWYELFPLFNRG